MDFHVSPIIGILSAIWIIVFLFARSQTERIKQRTQNLLLEQARLATKRGEIQSIEQFYEQFQPIWELMLKKTAVVILHRTELFPVRAHPETVRKRLNFTPAWYGAYLRLHGFKWGAEPQLEEEIQSILKLASNPQRAK
jgi:hypothetical protein